MKPLSLPGDNMDHPNLSLRQSISAKSTTFQIHSGSLDDSHKRRSLAVCWNWHTVSQLLWLLWKLPRLFSRDFGRLGPAFGVGVGFGFGFGFGLIGGAGFGFRLPGMQFGIGFGAGFGVGLGFGYGLGRGWALDENGEHCNLPSTVYKLRDEIGDVWDQFLHNTKVAFDSVENINDGSEIFAREESMMVCQEAMDGGEHAG